MVALSTLMVSNPGVASTVASLPWVKRGLTDDNRGALQLLAVMAKMDVSLAKQLVGLPWLADDVTQDERLVMRGLSMVAEQDPQLARTVADLEWLQDDVTEDERLSIEWLREIGRQDPARLGTVLEFAWLDGPITEDAKWTIKNFRDIGREDPALDNKLAGSPWINDELTEDERWIIRDIRDLALIDLSLARPITELPWFADAISQHERRAVRDIQGVAEQDIVPALRILDLPWIRDEITEEELQGIRQLLSIAEEDTAGLSLILGLPWLMDSVTGQENSVLDSLGDILQTDVELGQLLARSPFLEAEITSRDEYALDALQFLERRYAAIFDQIQQHAWFEDGIDDNEAALILVFGHSSQYFDPDSLQHLLADHRVESKTIVFPLGAEIASTSIQSTQERARQDIVSLVEESAQEIELFMDIPFPMDDLILLFAGCEGLAYSEDCNFRGLHAGNHIVVDPRLAIKDARGTLIHEVAHYYLNSRSHVPLWFYEGGADFLEAYVEIQLYGETLESRKRWVDQRNIPFCRVKGINSIQRLIEKLAADGCQKHRESEVFWCNYAYGEALFLHLYETIGESAFRTAWKDIYHSGATNGSNLSEQEIYQKFREHTPEEKLQEFREVYKRWHGGQFVK